MDRVDRDERWLGPVSWLIATLVAAALCIVGCDRLGSLAHDDAAALRKGRSGELGFVVQSCEVRLYDRQSEELSAAEFREAVLSDVEPRIRLLCAGEK